MASGEERRPILCSPVHFPKVAWQMIGSMFDSVARRQIFARRARARGAISVQRVFVPSRHGVIMKRVWCWPRPCSNFLCACVWLNVSSKSVVAMCVSTCASWFSGHVRVRCGHARPLGRIRPGGAPARMGRAFGSANGSTSGARRATMRPKTGPCRSCRRRRISSRSGRGMRPPRAWGACL
jgi:hypothetical protein